VASEQQRVGGVGAYTVSTNDGRLPKEDKVFKSRFTQSWILGVVIAPGLAVASTISIQPAATTVSPGNTFTVSIMASGFTVPVDAGGLNITWNPSVLTLGPAGVTLDPIWVPPSTKGTVASGSITGMFLFDNTPPNPNPTPGTPFNIATIQFMALASASGLSSSITPTENLTNPFAGGGAQITGIIFSNGTVTVPGGGTTTPEPQSAALMLTGLGLCAWLYRRRSAA